MEKQETKDKELDMLSKSALNQNQLLDIETVNDKKQSSESKKATEGQKMKFDWKVGCCLILLASAGFMAFYGPEVSSRSLKTLYVSKPGVYGQKAYDVFKRVEKHCMPNILQRLVNGFDEAECKMWEKELIKYRWRVEFAKHEGDPKTKIADVEVDAAINETLTEEANRRIAALKDRKEATK